MASDPTVLLLDEPAAGLDTGESGWLAQRLQELRSTGVTLLVIDHDMELIFALCDLIHVLDVGRIIATGTPDQIRSNERVMQAYLGVPPEATSPEQTTGTNTEATPQPRDVA
jgi:ABC-type branched-subunit amino acid transport system ATPase component